MPFTSSSVSLLLILRQERSRCHRRHHHPLVPPCALSILEMMPATGREKMRGRIGKKNEGGFCFFFSFSFSAASWFGTISKKNKTADCSSSLRLCACVPDPSFSLLPSRRVVVVVVLVVILLCLIRTDFVSLPSAIFWTQEQIRWSR